MILTKQDFEEGTAFELYVLETAYPAIGQHDGACIDLRRGKTIVETTFTISESLSTGAVDQLKGALAPLLFGTAWKVLDLLMEFALSRAGFHPRRRDWRIEEKQRHALEEHGDSSVLGCSHLVWVALLKVYAETVEHRHCLIHRTAKVDTDSGALEGVDRNSQPLSQLTREEQVALVKASSLVARGVIDSGISKRSEDHLKYFLDHLNRHLGMSEFGVGEAGAPVEIKLALVREGGQFFLDVTDSLARAQMVCQTATHFNLTIDVPDGSGRHLFAQAEDCPPGKLLVDLDDLPQWLEYR